MYPLDLLIEWLKKLDEVQILELLDISTEELLESFADRVKQRRRYLEKEMEVLDPSEGGDDLDDEDYESDGE